MISLSNSSLNIDQGRAVSYPTLLELAEAFQAINNKEDFSQLSNTILEKAVSLSCSKTSTLLLVNKTTGELEIAAVWQVPEEVITGYLQQPVRVAKIGEFYQKASDPFTTEYQFEGIRDLAAAGYDYLYILPIRIRQKIIGYLTLSSEKIFLNEKTSQEKFNLYLEFVAQAIESAYFIYQLRQQNAHLELMMTKLQNTRNNLKRTEKMALVGKLAASVAHEIRNPLTIIGTSLQLVFERMPSGHQDRELFDTMITKVRTVDQTIRELMVFTRPVQLELKSFSLANALERVITFVSKKYESKGLKIIKEIPDSMPNVFLDEEQIQRIIINLLLNAYENLDENGSVHISASYDNHQPWLQLMVADNGRGIPREHIQQIFEPFFTTRADGSGLGLFMVKNLIEEMEGTIQVKNQEPKGVVFTLRLPIAK